MAQTIRILIADDHAVVRAGLRSLLESQGHFRVVAEAETGQDAIRLAMEQRPDIVVLDIRMPGISGIDACRQIVNSVPGCRVIMLTAYAEDELLMASLQAGASGYVLKRIGDNELVRTVERISHGEGTLEADMAAQAFDEIHKANQVKLPAGFEELTPQELSVLAHLAYGMTNRQIAGKLYLGEGTVRNYVSSILSKLNVHNRAEAAAYATQHKITEIMDLDDD